MTYRKEFAADADSGEIVAERTVSIVTPAMKKRLLQIYHSEVTTSRTDGFGYVNSNLGGWTYVMVRKLMKLKLIDFVKQEGGNYYRIKLTFLGVKVAGVRDGN